MVLAKTLETYEDNDNQFQSDEAIGYQVPMPSDLTTLELSWDRRKAFMRVIIPDKGTWYFKALLGKAQLISTDDERGRLYLKAMPLLDGDTLYLYRDLDALPHEKVDGIELTPTNNRLCYNRRESCWRIRDERMPWMDDASRRLCKNYVGDINLEWDLNDPIAHIFHKGYITIDNNDVAHLYDPEIMVNGV